MSESLHGDRLLTTFAKLADTLVDSYDVVDLLQLLVDSCRDLLDVTEAGILLQDGPGELEVVASTSESSRLVEAMQLSAQNGPCIESYLTGRVVNVPDIAMSPERWERFRASALEQGFHSAYAIPMRLRETTIGTVNLLRNEPGELGASDIVAAQAFADVATIGILHQRSNRENEVVAQQLRSALNSRIIIEQAKGVVAHTHGVLIDEAFDLIRGYARSNRLGLSEVAARLVDRSLTLD
jgi:transcriptional regulator with GAF, ATPase, and Fis domain